MICIITFSPKIVIQRIALQMFKLTYSLLPSAISELFILNSAIYKYNSRVRTKLIQCFEKHDYMWVSETLKIDK